LQAKYALDYVPTLTLQIVQILRTQALSPTTFSNLMGFNIPYYENVDPDNLQNQLSPNETWDDYPCGYLEYDDDE